MVVAGTAFAALLLFVIRSVVRSEFSTFSAEVREEMKTVSGETHKQLEEIRDALRGHDEDIANALAQLAVHRERLDHLKPKR